MNETGQTDQPETHQTDSPTTGGLAAAPRTGLRLASARTIQVAVLVLALVVVLVVWLARGTVPDPSDVGYAGVFFLSFLGSAAMVLPVPGLISLCGGSLFLNPFALGMLAATGETIGEISGYAVGFGGRGVVEKSRTYIRIRRWMKTRGWIVILVVSIIPNPLFDLVGIAAGATRYPVARFLGIVFVGKTVKGLTIAYACSWVLELLPWVS
jgi:membrane protein YqaA with SNARE-associated domain